MMKNNKILINIKNLYELENYKKIGITNFLFALKDFSIGYPGFSLEELKKLDINIYLNVNIIMDTKQINEFKKLIPSLSFIKGLFFEDLGVYYVLRDTDIPLIWNQAHFAVSEVSINSWLERVSSALLANELTNDEIKYILDRASKPLILPVFGYNMAMYSRRYLLSNFNRYYGYKLINKGYLKINEENSFITEENNNGTLFFYHKPFNYLSILNDINDEKILFYYFDMTKMDFEDYLKITNNEFNYSEEKFLKNKTIYKLED